MYVISCPGKFKTSFPIQFHAFRRKRGQESSEKTEERRSDWTDRSPAGPAEGGGRGDTGLFGKQAELNPGHFNVCNQQQSCVKHFILFLDQTHPLLALE